LAATIKDIAKRANVSTATVSYVVNGSRTVSPELVERVQHAVAEFGYAPNAVARSLRQARTRTIGLVIEDNANPFFAEIAKGVEDQAYGRGYSVLLCNSNKEPDREHRYLDLLLTRRVDGLVFFSTTGTAERLGPFVAQGIPVVAFYRDVRDLPVDTIKVDNSLIGYTATQHLIELGHQAIACIQPAMVAGASARRVDGYRRAMQEAGLEVNQRLVTRGDNLLSGGRRATWELLHEVDMPFTAIFACNDAMAIGSLAALHEAGLTVPRQVSVVGVDDIQLAAYAQPALTTVAQPKLEAGALAVDFLIERLNGSEAPPRNVVLDTHLVVRDSTAAAPGPRDAM
jgi:LacI family transcriptional regulator